MYTFWLTRYILCMFTLCSLYIHYIFTTCSLHVHYVFTVCSLYGSLNVHTFLTHPVYSLYVHFMFIVCSLYIHHLSTICSLGHYYMFTVCSLYIHHLFTICSLGVYCMFTVCSLYGSLNFLLTRHSSRYRGISVNNLQSGFLLCCDDAKDWSIDKSLDFDVDLIIKSRKEVQLNPSIDQYLMQSQHSNKTTDV